jgi:hypothetical protein
VFFGYFGVGVLCTSNVIIVVGPPCPRGGAKLKIMELKGVNFGKYQYFGAVFGYFNEVLVHFVVAT